MKNNYMYYERSRLTSFAQIYHFISETIWPPLQWNTNMNSCDRRVMLFLVTLSDLWPRFQGDNIILCQTTRTWCTIELELQRQSNSMSDMMCRSASFSVTLNDPKPILHGHANIRRWISQKQNKIETYLQCKTNRDSCAMDRCHYQWPWVTPNLQYISRSW